MSTQPNELEDLEPSTASEIKGGASGPDAQERDVVGETLKKAGYQPPMPPPAE